MAEAGRQAGRVARKERGRRERGRDGDGGGREGASDRGREGGRDEMA